MRFSAAVLALAATAVALPSGDHNWGVPDDMTVAQAQAKCGEETQLACCNKVSKSGDSTNVNTGPLSGALTKLVGSGHGSQGLGIFEQCSKLGANVPVAGGGVTDILNQKCKQNVVCCQNSKSTANNNLVGLALPCVALGSIA